MPETLPARALVLGQRQSSQQAALVAITRAISYTWQSGLIAGNFNIGVDAPSSRPYIPRAPGRTLAHIAPRSQGHRHAVFHRPDLPPQAPSSQSGAGAPSAHRWSLAAGAAARRRGTAVRLSGRQGNSLSAPRALSRRREGPFACPDSVSGFGPELVPDQSEEGSGASAARATEARKPRATMYCSRLCLRVCSQR